MRKVIVYTQSLNHLKERIFVARIDDGGVISEEVKTLSNVEISEQDIFEINSIIKRYSKDDEITIYCLSAYLNKKNEIKDKWRDNSEGKELLDLLLRYNIKIKKYNKQNEEIKNELIKIITTYHKNLKTNNHKTNQSTLFEKTSQLQQFKVYNDNSNIKNIINLFLRGSCDTSNENRTGCYIALLSMGDRNKIISGEGQNTTTNRMLLVGLIEALKILKTPCLIRLYTHTNIGFSGGNTNKDLKEKLFKLIIENNHAMIEIISDKKQEYLQTLLSEKTNIV